MQKVSWLFSKTATSANTANLRCSLRPNLRIGTIPRISSLAVCLSFSYLTLRAQDTPPSAVERELLAIAVQEILIEAREPRPGSEAAPSPTASSLYPEIERPGGRELEPPPGAAHYDPARRATAVSGQPEPRSPSAEKARPSLGSSAQNNSQPAQKPDRSAAYSTGIFEPEPGLDHLLASAAATSGRDGRPSLFAFIQINRVLTAQIQKELEEAGAQILGPHGNFHKIKLTRQTTAVESMAALPFVRWLGFPIAEQKIDLELRALLSSADLPERLPLLVNLFDHDDNGHFRRILEDIGLVVGAWVPELVGYRVVAEATQVQELVELDFVLFVELVGVTRAGHDQDMPVIGMDYLRTGGPFTNFNASPIILGIMDTGFMLGGAAPTMHNDLNKNGCGDNFTSDAADVWNDENGHGTHVIGTILGTGTANSRYRGAADGLAGSATTRVRAAKIWNSANTGTNAWMESAMDFFDNASECGSPAPEVINISGGGFALNLVGTDSNSRMLDGEVWTYGQFYAVCVGNNGPGVGTVWRPGVAKNALTVGNVRPEGYLTVGDVSVTSSRGPTGDGRMKPNVVAPGTGTTSALAGTTNQYTDLTGCSMATPHVSGLASTVMHHYSSFQGRPALLRAHLMATSILHDDDTTPGTNSGGGRNSYGLGRVSTYVAHWARNNSNGWTTSGSWGTVDDDTWRQRDITVPPGTDRLVVVSTWDEAAASAGAAAAVDYDLDLWIDRNADCTPDAIGQCGEYASQSSVDNVEYVIVDNPPSGTYRLKTIPWSAPASGLPIGMAAVVIRGDPTPAMNLTAVPSDSNPMVGDAFSVTTSLSSPAYVSSGVHLARTSFPAGVVQDDLTTTREDNIAMSFDDVELTLGNVHEGDTRSASWTFHATTAGSKTLSFRAWSENGGTDTVDVVVTACSADAFEPDDSSGQASPISSGSTQTHSICPVGDEDWVSFTLSSPAGVVVETSGPADDDTQMWLFDAQLDQVEFDDEDGTGHFSKIDRVCSVDDLPPGTYYVKVDQFGDDEKIAIYDLDLTAEECGCPANLLLQNDTLSGTQTFTGQTSITMGPNLIVDGTSIEVAAGEIIAITNDTEIGGVFHARISPNPCGLDSLRFNLTWDTDGTDLDLFVRTPGPNGVPDTADGETIYFFQTSADGGELDVDDVDGFGPENITFPSAAPGTYAFAVHYYSGELIATTATLNVFVSGQLTAIFSQVLILSDDNSGELGLTEVNPLSVFNAGTVDSPDGTLGPPAAQSVFIGPSSGGSVTNMLAKFPHKKTD